MASKRLYVPTRDYDAIHAFFNLSTEDTVLLGKALRETPANIATASYVEDVAKRAELPEPSLSQIVSLLLTLYRVRSSNFGTVSQFLDLFRESLALSGDERFKYSNEQWTEIVRRVQPLLEIDDPVAIVAKASALYFEHENTVHGFSLVTDFRPVFTSTPGDGVSYGLIMHSFTLSYHDKDSSSTKEVTVVVDEEDLDTLETLVARAKVKKPALERQLGEASIRILNGA
ncbi:MAG: hypothetical protein JWO59_3544 [Chloroflexi bacterium]|nr:hypothetical protein [Chloroflexota bacterium]